MDTSRRLLLNVAIMAMVLGPPSSHPMLAEVSPAAENGAGVRIIEGPSVERADPDLAVIRWASDTPGGPLEHFGVVRFGTDPNDLTQFAASHIRLNPGHSSTVFRVRIAGLRPRTVYYYRVDSMAANGMSDGVHSPVQQFTTAGNPQRPRAP